MTWSRAAAEDEPRRPDPYRDDRSGPTELIESYYNAVNRHEYLRAYSYWEANAAETQLPPYPDFARGYADTARVDVMIGDVSGDAGAGQLYYRVPVVLQATMKDGDSELFAGCYTLHLAQPSIQGIPPFRPLGIRSADIEEAPDDSDVGQLLADACAGEP